MVERKEVMLFEEVDDKSNKIIEFCTDPKSTKEIMEYLGFKERKSAFKYLRPLVEQGRIAKTIPDKPKSSKQRYVSIK